ncbi:hypothetical protein LTR10_024394 [Elasticomyces elasticus]|uniref:Major facilitator superfamily (MFS) profile domain-containing protein n=1 Tax=Exophiala sideris TaxID=1016849 RepID=A0ABR0IYD7_9EURO|nr:hypothetical protein LTR10_024394 [Elasticomyces elasticus]KAK5022591.1 hypothetical protein LTS07_009814 [Exophiala sideris]KAK5027746.1 hypothetical protein LTR13_009453 [Exophiala sideris]KAK5052166.1 hypothetical protein LTR69_009928 [Exophiala sideris]KAK5178037.1 hypothetical protein LTR44_009586 [Eurotiomycetes sp. CCFEE 6388]
MASQTVHDEGNLYKRSNLKVIGYCMIVGLLAVTQGLDIGETAGFLAMPRFNQDFGSYSAATQAWSTTAGQQTEMFGLLLGGAIVSSAASGWIGAHWGRRFGIFLGAITAFINPIIQATVTTWPGFMVGKVISGIGIGFGQTFVIPYWSETTPAALRGMMLVALQGIINVFTFVGQCINEGTHGLTTRWAYRGPLLTELLAPLILLVLIYWIPETPRYLVSRGRYDDALNAMRKLRGPTYPEEEIQEEVKEVMAMDRIEKELEGASRWRDCFQGTDLRRTVVSVIAILCQEFSGIAFITGYGTYFFSISGVTNPFVISVITGLCGIVGSAAAFPLIKFFGRRPILITGAAAQGVSMLTFAIVAVAAPGSKAASQCLAAFVSLFIFSYGATWGAVGPVVLGELSSTKLRSKTLALCYIAGWSADLLIICGTPYLISADYANLGAKVGFIFGGISILVFIWCFLCLPETKDRTLEEIDEMFMNKVPARKFKTYVITKNVQGISVQAEMDVLAEKVAVSTVETVERAV